MGENCNKGCASAGKASADKISANKASATAATSKPQNRQPVRARNEDDDGYDPYSDYHDRRVSEPLFERDPWN